MNASIDISGVQLKTGRMVLRPWRESDLEDFYAYASVDGVGQMAGWTPHKNREESNRILRSFIAHKKTFALEYQGRVIGSLGIEEYDEEVLTELEPLCCRELGFVLSRDYWGRGLMAEAVNSVVQWLFEEQHLDAIVCCHFARNHQSARVQEKCGFQPYQRSKYETQYGTVEDEIVNLLRREDWLLRCEEAELTPEVTDALVSMSEDWLQESSCRGYVPNREEDLKNYRVFIARKGERIVGYLLGEMEKAATASSVMEKDAPFFEIQELYIRPEFRSCGIGRALFQYAETCVKGEAACIRLTAVANRWKELLHFYIEELGMEFWSASLFKIV